MYKALNLTTGEDIIVISPVWSKQIPTLRSLDKQDLLVCPTCRKPVRVRAGRFRRRHFAHKHLENCPYQNESPILLDARAVLYEWLLAQFGDSPVDLEVKLDIPYIQRPVDAWVSTGNHSIAYWIIDRRMPPDEREHLLKYFEGSKLFVNWIFVSSILSAGENPKTVFLTTTEREFMRHSEYDDIYGNWRADAGKSLHYLDTEKGEWITYRALRVMHPPQAYYGHRVSHPVQMVRASPENGEPVHPGESALSERVQLERQEHDRQAADRLQGYSRLRGKFQVQDIPLESGGAWEPFAQEATCIFCGNKTRDWWYINKADGTCKCRDCKEK